MPNRRYRFTALAGALIVLSGHGAAQQVDLRILPAKGEPLVVKLKKKTIGKGEIWEGTGVVFVLNHSDVAQNIHLGYLVTDTGTVQLMTKTTTVPRSTDISALTGLCHLKRGAERPFDVIGSWC